MLTSVCHHLRYSQSLRKDSLIFVKQSHSRMTFMAREFTASFVHDFGTVLQEVVSGTGTLDVIKAI